MNPKTTPPLAEALATLKELREAVRTTRTASIKASEMAITDQSEAEYEDAIEAFRFANQQFDYAVREPGFDALLTAAEQGEKYRAALEEVVAVCWTCGGKGEINNGRWIGDVRIEPCPAQRCCIARKALETP